MKLTEEVPKIVDLRMDIDTVIITFKQEDITTTLSFKSELIKKWKDDAKKWRGWTKFRKTHYEPLYAEKMNKALGDVEGNYDIVQRLKKLRGKWHRKEVDDREFVEQTIEELQKILEEKK